MLNTASCVVVVICSSPGTAGSVPPQVPVPLPSVLALSVPRNEWPSPKPLASQAALEYTSTAKDELGMLLSVPPTVRVAPDTLAAVMTG